jgi:hypothetical protein
MWLRHTQIDVAMTQHTQTDVATTHTQTDVIDNVPDLNGDVMQGEQPDVGHQEHDPGHRHIRVGMALLPE